jgi:hypothetical protein
MKSKAYLFLAAMTILPLALAGCGPTSGDLPTCPDSGLAAPVLAAPANWAIADSLLPTLSWSYPDASCNPQGYAIEVSTGPFFTDAYGGGTGNPSTSWTPGYPLPLGEEFRWGVRAINGTTLGPLGGYQYFFTGPMCDTAALIAPYPLRPAKGAVISELDPTLVWKYPLACIPQGYRVDLSVDSTFADTSLSGGTGNPSTRWGPAHPLADCTVYFWKVAPINDTTLGPATDMWWFTTDVHGTCPTPTPVSTATPVPPTPTPTAVVPTDTPTPAAFYFTPNINANCRLGPGQFYPLFDVAMKGQMYLMDGRNAENDWYRIMFTPSSGCWVPGTAGMINGDPLKLRVLLIPTLIPSDTPTQVVDCSSFTDIRACQAHPACQWVPSITRAPYCADK